MRAHAKAILERVRAEGRRFVMEPEAKEVLRAYGVPVTEDRLCLSPEEVVQAAAGMPFPLVMKLVSPQVIHKTELGAVRLGIRSEREALEAFQDLRRKASDHGAGFAGALVSETAEGHELIIGSTKDPQFGQLIMLGMGGVLVEVYKDVAYRLAPVEERDAWEMLAELKGARVLSGYRGGKGAAIGPLIAAVVAVSQVLADFQDIAEMDLNPVFVGEEGLKVADARILLS